MLAVNSCARTTGALRPGGNTAEATTRPTVLLAICLLAGLALGILLHSLAAKRNGPPSADKQSSSGLCDATRATLGRLASPLEIHFYALLDPAVVPDSLPAFAGRVDALLAEYERTAGGKIKVTRFSTESDENSRAASADQITAFNRDKGNACFLGIALIQNGTKEVLSQLSPEWESALESDLTRAIDRLGAATSSGQSAVPEATVDPAAIEQVKQLLPNFASVPAEDGARVIREAGLKEFTAAAGELETQVKEAQERLRQAQNGTVETEQQAAMKHLQQVQAEGAEKLKAIAARSQAQVQAFQKLKATAR